MCRPEPGSDRRPRSPRTTSARVVAPKIRHAHRLERAPPVDRVDRDDVGVLQLGQGLRLAGQGRGHLDDRPAGRPGQVAGQEHPAERPAA